MAEDNGPVMTITVGVCTVVSFIFMALRVFSKQGLGGARVA